VSESGNKEFVVVVNLHLSQFIHLIFTFRFSCSFVVNAAINQTFSVSDALSKSVVDSVLFKLEYEVFPVVNDALNYLSPV
jgi:hypothetical protein